MYKLFMEKNTSFIKNNFIANFNTEEEVIEYIKSFLIEKGLPPTIKVWRRENSKRTWVYFGNYSHFFYYEED